ncbi:hypothetical protein PG999_000464 [Apiospora kogelbergensis]|uniref:Uncharacterized protein n=1 Tax=Apiospora kogelbergensis TaxID=1337665 RepID=A0AAW0RC05_9PEZI
MSRSHHHSSRGSKKSRPTHSSIQQHIESLETHRVNTLTELCRIERVAAACENEEDSRAFQTPMTQAWSYYVTTSQQFLTELRGLSPNYPFCAELVSEARRRVLEDPESNRSWNLAWLCLTKMQDEYVPRHARTKTLRISVWLYYTDYMNQHSGLVQFYASSESWRKEMWQDRSPTEEEADQLAQCFEYEWAQAVDTMLRHWPNSPTWY